MLTVTILDNKQPKGMYQNVSTTKHNYDYVSPIGHEINCVSTIRYEIAFYLFTCSNKLTLLCLTEKDGNLFLSLKFKDTTRICLGRHWFRLAIFEMYHMKQVFRQANQEINEQRLRLNSHVCNFKCQKAKF